MIAIPNGQTRIVGTETRNIASDIKLAGADREIVSEYRANGALWMRTAWVVAWLIIATFRDLSMVLRLLPARTTATYTSNIVAVRLKTIGFIRLVEYIIHPVLFGVTSDKITFKKVCAMYGCTEELYKYNAQDNYIEFYNGSRIDLLDLQYMICLYSLPLLPVFIFSKRALYCNSSSVVSTDKSTGLTLVLISPSIVCVALPNTRSKSISIVDVRP